MANVLAIVGASLGLFTWYLLFVLMKGAGPLGPPEVVDWLYFGGPLLALLLYVGRLVDRGAWVAAIWLAAVAPIVAGAAVAATFAVAVAIGGPKDVSQWVSLGLSTAVWTVLAWRITTAPIESSPTAAKPNRPYDEALASVDWKELGGCPNCGALLRLGSARCGRCGAHFSEGDSWRVTPLAGPYAKEMHLRGD